LAVGFCQKKLAIARKTMALPYWWGCPSSLSPSGSYTYVVLSMKYSL